MTTEPANTVCLHIGIHKTGTTSIQATLGANRALLQERGALFSRHLSNNHSRFFTNAVSRDPENYHANLWLNLSRQDIAADTAKVLDLLREEFAGQRGRTIIFSAEDACPFDIDAVTRLKDCLTAIIPVPQFMVLLYVRDPVDFVSSAVKENVKGNGMTLERSKQYHMRMASGKYERIFQTYATVFGRDALLVKSFEVAAKAPGGLVADFFATLGLSFDGMLEIRKNESICVEVVEFLSWVQAERLRQNDGPATDFIVAPVGPKDREILFQIRGNRSGLLSPAEIAQIRQVSAGDIAFLQDSFGISYGAAAPDTAGPGRAFDAAALRQIADLLPGLTPETRAGFLRFLLLRHP